MDRPGTLILAATPIGNLSDASQRLRAVLGTADVIVAEDTRQARKLLAGLDVTTAARIISSYDAVEARRVPVILEELRAGRVVVMVSDAGTPIVNDPGHHLVAACAEHGIPVTVVPGPSAVLAAAVVSGFGGNRLSFEGFLPRRGGERLRALADVRDDPRTLVFFESPHRVSATLTAMADVFGPDRQAVVCREMTKLHEEIRRGTVAELAQWAAPGLRGEVTIVVAGTSDARLRQRTETGDARKDAIAAVSAAFGLPKRTVYDAVVAARRAGEQLDQLA